MDKVTGPLEIHLGDMATPARVEAAARMFREVLRVVCPGLPEGSFTMVVSNLDMTTALRPRTREARKATQMVLAFMRGPERYVEKHPDHAEISAIVGEFMEGLTRPATVTSKAAQRVVATLDKQFTETLHTLQQRPQGLLSTEWTTVYSKVLRVGRTAEGKQLHARIVVRGRPEEIRIKGDSAPFYALAQSEGMGRVTLFAAWQRLANGRLQLDAAQSSVTKAAPMAFLDGATALARLDAATGALREMSDEDFDERVKASRW